MQRGLLAIGTPPEGGPTAQSSCPWRVEGAGFAVLVVAGAVLLLLQLAITSLSWHFEPVTPLLDLPIGRFVALQVSAGVVYLAVILVANRTRVSRALLITIAAVGLLLRAAAWPSQPILEDDFHRYLWDGAASSAGVSPYRFAPAEILGGDAAVPERLRLEALSGGATVAQINHPALTTIYPPVAQAAFLLAHLFAPFDLDAWKFVLLIADAATAFLLFRLLTALGLPHTLLAIYWWNPLLVTETFNSAHMDVLLLPFLLGALLMRMRRRPFSTAALLALATGVKLWPVLLAPLLLAPWIRRPGRRLLVPLAYATLTGLFLLPMLVARWAHSGLASYTQGWEMNNALFAALSWLAGLVPGLAGAAPILLRVALAAALAALAGIVGARDLGSPAALARGALVVTAALLLASPAQFPWYFLWLLPLLALVPSAPLLALTAVLPLYYLRFHFLAAGAVGLFDHVVVFLEWVPIWVLLLWALVRRNRPAGQPRLVEEA